jgi:hypothetical protein
MKFIYLLPLPLLAFTADTWQPFIVDKHVTVQFPSQPQEMNLAALAGGRDIHHGRMWYVQASDAFYSVSRSHMEEALAPQDTSGRRRRYSLVFEALLREEKGQLVDFYFFPTLAGQGVEVKYRGLHKVTQQRRVKIIRCLAVDTVLYTLNFMAANKTDTLGLTGAEQRRRFFNSVTVKP